MRALKTVWKRGLSLFVTMALVLTMTIGMSVTAFADVSEGTSSDDYWSISVEASEGTAAVTVTLLQDLSNVAGGTVQLAFDSDVFSLATDEDGNYLVTVPDAFCDTDVDYGYDASYSIGADGTIAFMAANSITSGASFEAGVFLVYYLTYDDSADVDYSFTFEVSELYDLDLNDVEGAISTAAASGTIQHTHDYVGVVTDPTCTEQGYTTYTCSICEDSYVDDYTDALGHSYEAVVTDPTCTEGGYTTYTCSVCGDIHVDDYTDALGHSYDEGVVTTEPTCTEAGVLTYTCSVCGNTYTEEIAATGHSWDGVVTTEATCVNDGEMTYICTVCGETYTEVIAATGEHDYVAVVTDPTCTEQGYTTYTCSVCGDSYVDDYTDALGHSYDAVVTDPTCTEGGYTTYTCSVCGDSYAADYTDALGHSYEAVVTDPTCTEQGYTTYTCSVCGDSYAADYTDALGHSYEAVVTDPTCTEQGFTTYTCSVCGDSYVDNYTDALGHSYGDAVFTWSDDYSTATITMTCANDETHVLTAEASVTSETVEATGTADGSITYTATAEINGVTVTDTQTVVLPATGSDDTSGGDSGNGDNGSTDGDSGSGDEDQSSGSGDKDQSSGSGDEDQSSGSGDEDQNNGSGNGGASDGTTAGSSYSVPTKVTSPSKVSLTGATIAQATAALQMLNSDDDLADSTYSLLQAKAKKTTKKSIKLTWKKVNGAVSYVVYANSCGKGKKLKKYKVTGKTSLNIKKVAGKKLKKGKYYKFLVVAIDENGQVIQTSKVVHAATKGGSVTNTKTVTITKKNGKKIKSLTISKGKSVKIKTKTTKQQKSKKFRQHRKVKYESGNKKIATVNKNGKIKAKSKGTCYIYAYAQNGVCKKIKVTVK